MSEIKSVIYPINLDTKQNIYQIKDVMQGNRLSVSLHIYLTEDGIPIDLPSSENVVYRLEGSRPDTEKSPIQEDFTRVEGNLVVFEDIGEYITNRAGEVKCILSAYDFDTKKVLKFPYSFSLNVQKSPFNEEGVIHSDEFSSLTKLIFEAREIIDKTTEQSEELEILIPILHELEEDLIETNETVTAQEEIRKTNEVERQSAETTRIDNETTRQSNEDVRKTNEADRISAEDIRIENEDIRQDNEAIRITNEASRITEEDIRKVNETERISAENIRIEDENERNTAEEIRIDSESERVSNELDRQTEESTRQSNETVRKENEAERISAENIRIDNEDTRQINETERIASENTRKTDESTRITNESERVSAEDIRIENEATRETNEDARLSEEETRQANELVRESNENDRISAENLRQTAELKRQTDTATAILDANTATDRANTLADRCEEIIEDGTGISDTQIDRNHAFSNLYVDSTYITSELDEGIIAGDEPTINPVIQSELDDLSLSIQKNASDIDKIQANGGIVTDAKAVFRGESNVDDDLTSVEGDITDLQDDITGLQTQVSECFLSVSNGKELVANAITDKGVTTSTDATFATMAENIELIQTGIDTDVATATSEDLLFGKTAGIKGQMVAGTMANKASTTTPWCGNDSITVQVHPTDSNQALITVPNTNASFNGYYDTTSTVTGEVANLSASNIKAGVKVGRNAGDSTNCIIGTFTSEATATSDKLLEGVTAGVNGEIITGIIVDRSQLNSMANGIKTLDSSRLGLLPQKGYYDGVAENDGYVFVDYNILTNHIGLTSDNLMVGQTILGVDGTFTSDANANSSQILTGYSCYVNGNKVEGGMEDYTNQYVEPVNVVMGSNLEVCPTTGYYNGTDANVAISPSTVANAIGLTAENIVVGNTICGIVGVGVGEGKKYATGTSWTPIDWGHDWSMMIAGDSSSYTPTDYLIIGISASLSWTASHFKVSITYADDSSYYCMIKDGDTSLTWRRNNATSPSTDYTVYYNSSVSLVSGNELSLPVCKTVNDIVALTWEAYE